LGGKLFTGIKVENGSYKFPGNIGAKYCRISSTRSNEKLEDWSRKTEKVEKEKLECRERSTKAPKRIKKVENVNKTVMKMAKINRQSAKISIRVSSALNLINIEYAKKKELTWKCLSKETTTGCIKEPIIDENVIDKGCITKRNINQRESELVDVRYIKAKLIENDSIDEEKKKGRIVNVMNFGESNQMDKIKIKSIPTVSFKNKTLPRGNRSKFGIGREPIVKKLVNDDNDCVSRTYNLGYCYRIRKDVSKSTDMGHVYEINEVNSYCGDGINIEIHDGTIGVGHCYQGEAIIKTEYDSDNVNNKISVNKSDENNVCSGAIVISKIDSDIKEIDESKKTNVVINTSNNEICQTDNGKNNLESYLGENIGTTKKNDEGRTVVANRKNIEFGGSSSDFRARGHKK
ncbi:4349_t:CDS:2, partial [Racocetra persica]